MKKDRREKEKIDKREKGNIKKAKRKGRGIRRKGNNEIKVKQDR